MFINVAYKVDDRAGREFNNIWLACTVSMRQQEKATSSSTVLLSPDSLKNWGTDNIYSLTQLSSKGGRWYSR